MYASLLDCRILYFLFCRILGSQDAALLKQLQLNANAKQYSYLAGGGEPYTIKGVAEKDMYRATREAMTSVGLHEKEQIEVLKIIAAILHLGQVSLLQWIEIQSLVSSKDFEYK